MHRCLTEAYATLDRYRYTKSEYAPIGSDGVAAVAVLAEAAVGALVHVVALVERGAEAVAGRAAALEGAGRVDALRQAAARRRPRRALVHVAAQVRRVVVLVPANPTQAVPSGGYCQIKSNVMYVNP